MPHWPRTKSQFCRHVSEQLNVKMSSHSWLKFLSSCQKLLHRLNGRQLLLHNHPLISERTRLPWQTISAVWLRRSKPVEINNLECTTYLNKICSVSCPCFFVCLIGWKSTLTSSGFTPSKATLLSVKMAEKLEDTVLTGGNTKNESEQRSQSAEFTANTVAGTDDLSEFVSWLPFSYFLIIFRCTTFSNRPKVNLKPCPTRSSIVSMMFRVESTSWKNLSPIWWNKRPNNLPYCSNKA